MTMEHDHTRSTSPSASTLHYTFHKEHCKCLNLPVILHILFLNEPNWMKVLHPGMSYFSTTSGLEKQL